MTVGQKESGSLLEDNASRGSGLHHIKGLAGLQDEEDTKDPREVHSVMDKGLLPCAHLARVSCHLLVHAWLVGG